MRKILFLNFILASATFTTYSKHQDPKRLLDLIGGAPELAVRFVAQMKQCKEAKENRDGSQEERYCDFDPLLVDGENGNGKSTLYRVMESETGVYAQVLTVANVGHPDPTECFRRIKEQVDYAAASAEAFHTPRYLVIEEVEEFDSGVQSGIKDLADSEAYWGKLQFVFTSNNFAGVRGDLIDRCGSNRILKYRPEKENRHTYLEAFCSEFGLQPSEAQLKFMQESSNKLNVRSLLLVIKNLSKKCDGAEIALSNDQLRLEIENVLTTQRKYNDAHGLEPGFYSRHQGAINGTIATVFTAGVGAAAGVFKEELRRVPGLVLQGAKASPTLVATGAGKVWHIFF